MEQYVTVSRSMVCKLIFSNVLTGGYAIDRHVIDVAHSFLGYAIDRHIRHILIMSITSNDTLSNTNALVYHNISDSSIKLLEYEY